MSSRLAVISFLDDAGAPVYPGNALPGGPVYPGQGLPGGPNYPGNALPGGGHIALLPVFPFDPTVPDNTLPGTPPTPGTPPPTTKPIVPGAKFVVKWLACHGLILVPDNSLPTPPTAEPKK